MIGKLKPPKPGKLPGKSSKKPMAVTTAAPAPAHKPMQVTGNRSTAGRSAAPAAPAAPIGRGPRSRTPRQYEP